jgi:uncharacterized membrane protein required for colicin V production
MTIWILIILLFGFLAWMGYVEGAIRVTIMLLGLLAAIRLALPLAPVLKPLVPMVGITNPYLVWLLPPLAVFILVQLIFTAVAFLVHRKVGLYYKYKADDVHRLRWERLNKRLGICVGLAAACVYLILIGLLIGIFGYVSVQVAAAENRPLSLQLLNSGRSDLRETGLDKIVAKFDPTPPTFYEAADIVGLVYHNPLLQSRLSAYPALLSLEERSEFQELANDKDFIELFQRQEQITQVMNHPRIHAIAKNPDIIRELAQIDFKDLQQYLQTGVSPKYEDQELLGRWHLNLNVTLAELKKALPKLPASAWKIVRKALTKSAMSLTATTDNKIFVKVQATKEEIMKLAQSAPAPPAGGGQGAGGQSRPPGRAPTARSLAARADPNAVDPRMQQRYRNGPATPEAAPPTIIVAPPPAQPPSVILKLIFSGEGTWQKERDDKYKITVKDEKEHRLEGVIRKDTLILAQEDLRLILEKE